MERKEINLIELLDILFSIFCFLIGRPWTTEKLIQAHLSGYLRRINRQFMGLWKFEEEIQL